MSQLDTHVQAQPNNHAEPNPSAPNYVHRRTRTEDLSILAHAQHQFQSYLAPTGNVDLSWRPLLPQQLRQSHSEPWPRSTHQIPSSALEIRPECRTPATHLPLRWWENDSDLESSSYEATGEAVDHASESDPALVVEEDSVVESIEVEASMSPATEENARRQVPKHHADGEEARLWGEAQQDWNGYVKQKESWVRRAGLKREREELDAQQGPAKKGRVSR